MRVAKRRGRFKTNPAALAGRSKWQKEITIPLNRQYGASVGFSQVKLMLTDLDRSRISLAASELGVSTRHFARMVLCAAAEVIINSEWHIDEAPPEPVYEPPPEPMRNLRKLFEYEEDGVVKATVVRVPKRKDKR